jgi:hypothetical protein
MYSKDGDRFEGSINAINSLCNELDFLASPTIEEKMICSLDCCIGNSRRAQTVIDGAEEYEEMRSIVGDEGLQLVRQLEEIMYDACYYDDEKGFSKKQRWLDFVVFVNKVNVFLKDAVKRYEAIQ